MNALALPDNFVSALVTARRRGIAELSAEIATELGWAEPELRKQLAQRFGFQLAEMVPVSTDELAFGRLSITDCRERGIAPFERKDGLLVAIADPWDADLQDWLQGYLDVDRVNLLWADAKQIGKWLETALTRSAPQHGNSSEVRLSDSPSSTRTISLEAIVSSPSPVVRFVDSTILDAWKAGASDIHFETSRSGLDVRLRMDGVLVPTGRFDAERPSEEIINRIKVLAQLDVSETRVPQDGRFRARLADRDLDFRVSVMPSIFGEDAVIRLLDKAQLRSDDRRIDLQRLGFEADVMQKMRALALLPHGMFLVTGPTGSGKTTTLYAVLSEIYSSAEKLITIEDPVEYELPGVLQIPVNEKKGLTFARGLRSILRHDPDRILVGEIRDQETAEIAIQAALTGHLVFTTVHANNVFDVVGRFTHMGVDLYNFMAALNGVVAQRLLRTNCPRCAADQDDPVALARISRQLPHGTPINLRSGAGCGYCRDTGYKGRTAIAEVLGIDEAIREMVIKRLSGRQLRDYAAENGLRTLSERAYWLVATGITTLEEVDRVVGASD